MSKDCEFDLDERGGYFTIGHSLLDILRFVSDRNESVNGDHRIRSVLSYLN